MFYRAAKDSNGVIICISTDSNQSGNYSDDEGDILGTWCSWNFEEAPVIPALSDAVKEALELNDIPLRLKENGTADGFELRDDAEMIANPYG